MDSYLWQWFIDLSSICSVVGLVLTYAVWIKTKKIKQDLISKTRLPKVVKALSAEVSGYIAAIEIWRAQSATSSNDAILRLGKIKGMLDNAKYHVSSDELKAVNKTLATINRKRVLIFVIPLVKLSFDEAENISIELNALASMLEQRVNDLRVPV